MKKVNWNFIKSISNRNNVPISYIEDPLNNAYYDLTLSNNYFDLSSRVLKTDPRNEEQIEFEDNYKNNANVLFVPHVNRVDLDNEQVESGEGDAFNTWGFPTINSSFVFTLVSGEGDIQAELQASDDRETWSTVLNTKRVSKTSSERFQAVRMAGKFYRYTWKIRGTATFNIKITTTLKNFSTNRISSVNNYEDIRLDVLNDTSSNFFAADSPNVSVQIIRHNDGGSSAKYIIESSNDQENWNTVIESTILNADNSVSTYFSQQSARWYRIRTIDAAIGTNITADILWSGTG